MLLLLSAVFCVSLTALAQGMSESSHWPGEPDPGKGTTFWQEGSDETGNAGHNVARGEGQAPANAINCHYNQESSRQLHSSWDEEVQVEVSPDNSQAHDKPLVDKGTCEPKQQRRKKCWEANKWLEAAGEAIKVTRELFLKPHHT